MPAYVETLKTKIDEWIWADAELKAAVTAQIDAASTSDPVTFLDELITAHVADDENHVPEFEQNLRRLLFQYQQEGPGTDADAELERILRLYSA